MTDQVGEQDQQPGEVTPEVDLDELISANEKLESYNQKLVNEAKQWRQKYKGLRNEVESQETKVLEETENYKGLWEKANQKAQTLESRVNDIKKQSAKTTLKYQVAKYAKDARDIDDVISAINRMPGSVVWNEESGEFEGLDDAIGTIRKDKEYLFDKEKVGFVGGRPGSIIEKEKPFEEKFKDDPDAVWEEALKNGGFL